MIDYETFARIKHLHDIKGLRVAQIARELGLNERTVQRRIEAKHGTKPQPGINGAGYR